jgi:hypothetical protein
MRTRRDFPASVRHRYEKLDRFPEGFLVFGDAMCSFNPVYGQGMSVAALQAAALEQSLATGQLCARDFFAAGTVGPQGKGVDLTNWYLSKLHKAAHHDPAVSLAFLRVTNLLPPAERDAPKNRAAGVAGESARLRQAKSNSLLPWSGSALQCSERIPQTELLDPRIREQMVVVAKASGLVDFWKRALAIEPTLVGDVEHVHWNSSVCRSF